MLKYEIAVLTKLAKIQKASIPKIPENCSRTNSIIQIGSSHYKKVENFSKNQNEIEDMVLETTSIKIVVENRCCSQVYNRVVASSIIIAEDNITFRSLCSIKKERFELSPRSFFRDWLHQWN